MKKKIILLIVFITVFCGLTWAEEQPKAAVPTSINEASDLPDLIIKDCHYDGKYYLRIVYCNVGNTSSDEKFLFQDESDDGMFFKGNPYYPFTVPKPGECALTGGLSINLIGIQKGQSRKITCTIDWQNNVKETNKNNNIMIKQIDFTENDCLNKAESRIYLGKWMDSCRKIGREELCSLPIQISDSLIKEFEESKKNCPKLTTAEGQLTSHLEKEPINKPKNREELKWLDEKDLADILQLPSKEELKSLSEDVDCPDCVPSDIMRNFKTGGNNYFKIEIEHAYIADNGDYFIVFKTDSSVPDEFWNFAGFWGRGNILYPIQADGGMFSIDKIQSDLINPKAKGKIEHIGKLDLTKGELTISCGVQEKKLTPMPEDKKAVLIQQVRDKEVIVKDLSDIRNPTNLFKLKESDIYIYLDSSRFISTKTKPRFFMGKAGDLQEYKIEHYYYFMDGGTTIILVQNKGKLFIPQTMSGPQKKKPYWQALGSDKKEGIEIIKFDDNLLKSLEIDTSKHKISEFPTPCDIF